ncbi:hypothetical protein EON63_20105 [archaeon]|nr:MAG: hypothetical protein EON63_20105 [archaeon]
MTFFYRNEQVILYLLSIVIDGGARVISAELGTAAAWGRRVSGWGARGSCRHHPDLCPSAKAVTPNVRVISRIL